MPSCQCNPTFGIGILTTTLGDCPMAKLVAPADAALYEAKRSGRDRYILQTHAEGGEPVSCGQEI
ncbi:hypothetical protein [uncultured Thermosynechococcus sp.]|uniref:hypothetical protein n=1 Tax=uncultured Thermosynechococcus sp. TaxID=436945 RepID=UPI00261C3382|nr:hypothetical protein [uncultured Thermosynechococcus sp.]